MLTLADAMLDKFGGDSMAETRDNLEPLPRADRQGARPAATMAAPPAAAAARPRTATSAGSGGDD